MSVAVSYLINGFLVLILRVLIFIFEHNCRFYEFILFRFRIITKLTSPLEGKRSWQNEEG